MGPDMLKTHVTDREARISAKQVVERWHELDHAGREAFLNGVRFTEMRGGALLAYLAENIEADRPEVAQWREQARGGLAASREAYEKKATAAARERMAGASSAS